VVLQHASGFISHLRASTTTAAPGPRLRVLGTEAAFVVSDRTLRRASCGTERTPTPTPDCGMEPATRWGRPVTGEDSVPVPSERGAWPWFYSSLATALRSGGPPPVSQFDAVATLRVLDDARRSANNRAVIAIPD
jgi:scyllo-inositol 2-dehydrogenase (NADP+)